MNELVKSYIAAVIRAGLIALGGWLAKNHFSDIPGTAIPGVADWLASNILIGGALVWSLIHKTKVAPKA